jgi:thiol-disulfide isomerase/thioredoxin
MNKTMISRIGLLLLAVAIAVLWYRYRQPNFRMGDKAPDFEVTLIDGRKAQRSDLDGHYALLQFWGSWCGPCRAENPALAEIYQRFQQQGFSIMSIGLEANEKSWRRAIQQDGMVWPWHAMEPHSFSGGISQMFNIKSIPTTFLLDPDGTIIGVNMPPEQIEKTLSERLAGR